MAATTVVNGALPTADVNDINAHLEAFRKSDDRRTELVLSLVRQLEQLRASYEEKCRDYENEKQSRRAWQTEVDTARAALKSAEGNPFILALIDGDGVVFQEALLKAGSEGGSDAAHKLTTEIKNHIQQRYEGAGHWSIMVQVYANFEGLARKLCSVGIIKLPLDLHAFARSFSLNQPLFSFIDVGSGKERADHKIKEMLRLFVNNHSCKHVIFGGCHDNGYLPNLDPYKHDTTTASRISLLESTPAQPGFKPLNFNVLRCDSVFRPDPLPESPLSQLSQNRAMSPQQLYQQQQQQQQQQQKQPPPTPVPIPVKPATPNSPKLSSPQTTWATVGKAGSNERKFSIAAKKFVPRKHICLNAVDHRIDPQLASADRDAQERLKNRLAKGKKSCNGHYLRGRCEAYGCPFDHKETLTPMDVLALRRKARQLPCINGGDCRDFDCFYGHHCTYPDRCMYEECRFISTHGMDQYPKFTKMGAWNTYPHVKDYLLITWMTETQDANEHDEEPDLKTN